MKAGTPILLRTVSALLGVAALFALSPMISDAAKRKKCVAKKEAAGCKLKNASYKGTTATTGGLYGVQLFIEQPSGAYFRGAARVSCTGTNPNAVQPTFSPLIQVLRLPQTLKVGKKYSKSGHIDQVQNTGQTKVRLIATETVSVKILSAKKARATITVNQSSQTVEPASAEPALVCIGSGTEVLKRAY